MITRQYQFDLHPYSLVHYKNCIFHGQIQNSFKQNTGILLLDNKEVLIGNFLNDQLNGDSLIFLNPQTYVIGSYTRGMLDGKFVLRSPKLSVYWTVRMNKIQGEIIVINYQTMTARIWVISNGQGNCLKQIDINQTDKESQTLSILSPGTQPSMSCLQFLQQKYAQSLTIESSALTQTTQISLTTNSTHKIKLTIFKEKLVEYGVYHNDELNGLGYCIEGLYILEGKFKNGKLDGQGLKCEIQQQKILYGTFVNGDVRTLDVITDSEETARKLLKSYKKQQHIFSLEFCNNYFNERPVLMLLNFLSTIEQNDRNFTKELEYQQNISLRSSEKPRDKSFQNTEQRLLTAGKLNLSIYSKDRTNQKRTVNYLQSMQNSDTMKKSQPYQSRFIKTQVSNQSNNRSSPGNNEFNDGISEFNRINKALRKFK